MSTTPEPTTESILGPPPTTDATKKKQKKKKKKSSANNNSGFFYYNNVNNKIENSVVLKSSDQKVFRGFHNFTIEINLLVLKIECDVKIFRKLWQIGFQKKLSCQLSLFIPFLAYWSLFDPDYTACNPDSCFPNTKGDASPCGTWLKTFIRWRKVW